MWLFGTKPSEYAPVPVNVALERPRYYTVGATGKEAPIKAGLKGEQVRNKVMEFLKGATGVDPTNS